MSRSKKQKLPCTHQITAQETKLIVVSSAASAVCSI